MMIDDARLIAYVDGELDAEARAQVEAALVSDPLLAARLARHRTLRERLAKTYDPVAGEAVPERLLAAAGASGRDNVVRLADRRAPPKPHPVKISLKWPAWGGIAATFIGGLALGFGAARETGGPLTVRGDGALMARGDLVRALNENRSGQPGAIRIGLSFRSIDRRYCRTFEVEAQKVAGVACREGPSWVARMTTQVRPDARRPAGYRAAASDTPLAVLEAVDAMMAGESLDASAEAMARARGWKD
jgi:hypothetical protein